MTTTVLLFGQLQEITSKHELQVNEMADTHTLLAELSRMYPAIATAKYMIAVDKQIISGNTKLKDGSTVALLPPFSGG
ncbi:MAG: MoaD/ThiS family protein [Sphingobacteriales bacterium]|jgi:sulfur-carrier protein|nr:MAG: MoaD/ThiS family protein [Sphingobacteriales bacterium]